MHKSQDLKIRRLIKEIRQAPKKTDECVVKKCKSIKNIKKHYEKINECKTKYKIVHAKKILDGLKDRNDCIKKKITTGVFDKIENCKNEKCNYMESIGSELMYLTHPHGKELKQLNKKVIKLKEQEKLCETQKCGHIYPLDKLEKENERCDKLLLPGGNKYDECMNKYKLYKHTYDVITCKNTKCKKILKSLNETRNKLYKIQNISSLKQMIKNIRGTKKSRTRK